MEFEGTYPLPEAQLDRFLLKISIGYPAVGDERTILERHHAALEPASLAETPLAAVPVELLAQARREVRAVRVEPAIFEYILGAVRRTREWPAIALGASPRASTSLLLVAKALAAREGRAFLVPDAVKAAAVPDRVVREVLQATPVPK